MRSRLTSTQAAHSFPRCSSIVISCAGLPKEVRWEFDSWNAVTHGNITVSWGHPLEMSVGSLTLVVAVSVCCASPRFPVSVGISDFIIRLLTVPAQPGLVFWSRSGKVLLWARGAEGWAGFDVASVRNGDRWSLTIEHSHCVLTYLLASNAVVHVFGRLSVSAPSLSSKIPQAVLYFSWFAPPIRQARRQVLCRHRPPNADPRPLSRNELWSLSPPLPVCSCLAYWSCSSPSPMPSVRLSLTSSFPLT